MTDVAYIALGSNVGNRVTALENACAAIAAIPGTRIIGATAVDETVPIGPIAQGNFLNQMISIETTLAPRALLAALQNIERAAGRVRTVRWGPRVLDLDVVMIEGREYADADLVIPHPELPNRDFWLKQLSELRGVHHD